MASDKFNYILYADDTTLIGNISNFKSINMQSSITDNINIELDKICDWLAVNKLSLNASKSNYMIFHHRQKKLKSTSIPILEMNHTLIKQVNELSFLGLTVNNHMDWNSHITNISNKITKTMGIMNRIKKSIPQQILNLMYNSLILPHIYFCDELVAHYASLQTSKLSAHLAENNGDRSSEISLPETSFPLH